jgi:tRNA uridine 5-carboxymethylaminomethyl modification enzyme
VSHTAQFDIIVIGGGHAGIEAVRAASRMGFDVLLLTLNIDSIGQMSCNPSVGGLAKGHLVKEVDALGGEIGLLADRTAVQFRMLNRSKGPAVWSPRTQNDRMMYRIEARHIIEHDPRVTVKQEEAIALIVQNNRIIGVRTMVSNEYHARAVVITAGTFLNGLMHIGLESFPGGRLSEGRSSSLSDSLRECGLTLGRLKTGTSPRVAQHSVDVSRLRSQEGDAQPFRFSLRTNHVTDTQLSCYITHTNTKTHEIIQRNLDRSPLYTGRIVGTGPRYCPSIETKIVRFAERESHLIFIEPEGRDSGEYYLNGLATSLPYDVQLDMMRSIKGLEKVEITRPGYAVEYDFVYPIQLFPSLETKLIKGLFCAGQINGTSGYEEAAAQGIMAGINAGLMLHDEKPFVLKRYEAYIGVLIDDLVTKNTEEPYRMFTSLAEHRLILRLDNVADRVMHYGVHYGLVDKGFWDRFRNERMYVDETIEYLKRTTVKPENANPVLSELNEPAIPEAKGGQSLFQLLKRPGVHYHDIEQFGEAPVGEHIGQRVEIEVKYDGYIKREEDMIARLHELEAVRIPARFDYLKVRGLSNEAKSKLKEIQPVNLDQASRIQGVSPSDILLLLMYIKKGS